MKELKDENMKKVKTEVVKSNGVYCVKFSINHQSFTLDNQLYGKKTSLKEANWFKSQLDAAFDRLLNSENTGSVSNDSAEFSDLH